MYIKQWDGQQRPSLYFLPIFKPDSVLLFPSIKVVLFIELPDLIDKQVFQDAAILFTCAVRGVYGAEDNATNDECIMLVLLRISIPGIGIDRVEGIVIVHALDDSAVIGINDNMKYEKLRILLGCENMRKLMVTNYLSVIIQSIGNLSNQN